MERKRFVAIGIKGYPKIRIKNLLIKGALKNYFFEVTFDTLSFAVVRAFSKIICQRNIFLILLFAAKKSHLIPNLRDEKTKSYPSINRSNYFV